MYRNRRRTTLSRKASTGGWYLWFVPPVLAFLLKVVLLLFLYIWLRGTFPRLRYDMLMSLGWKVLLPLAIVNVIVTGVILVATQGYLMADEEQRTDETAGT